MRVSVVYYSRKGTTKGLAEMVAQEVRALGNEVSMVPVRHRKRPGFFKAAATARKGEGAGIVNEERELDLTSADLVLLGGPVFAGNINAFIRTFLDGAKGTQGKPAGVFITCASPQEKAGDYIAQLRRLAEGHGMTVRATLIGSRKVMARYPAMARNFAMEALGVPRPAVEGDGDATGGGPDGDGDGDGGD